MHVYLNRNMKKYFITFLCLSFLFTEMKAQFLVAQYPFSINGNDSSGNNFHATAFGNATFNSGLEIGNNSADYALIPKKVFNGLMHCAISFDVKFDSLHQSGELPRNTILYGPLTVCGPVPLGVFYCKDSVNGQPQNSWLVYFDDKPYVVSDSNVLDSTWYHIEIKKDSGFLKFFKNGIQIYSAVDSSDTIHMALNCYVGQFAGCIGNPQTKSLFGTVKNLQVIDFDLFAANTEEEIRNDFIIFPNPAQTEVRIKKLNLQANVEVIMYDISGRIVKTFSIRNDMPLLIDELHSGIYFLEIKSDKFYSIQKLMKE